jgi:hypothetical protein
VHVTVSLEARLIVAAGGLTLVLFEGSVQTMLVRFQLTGMLSSVAVQEPGGTLNVCELGRVPSASSSREKSMLTVVLLVRLKEKSWALSGLASFTITIVPFGGA